MAITQREFTLEQFLKLPEQEPALEYLDGMVTRKMSPKGPHGTLQFEIGSFFREFVWPRRLARVFTETRTTYAGASFVPDLVVYRWERVPSDDQGDIPEELQTPPDIAIEVWSPGQTLGDLADRCRWYVEHGVPVALFVHPRRRWVRVFRPGVELGPFSSPARIDLGDVLPGFELDLAELFRWLRARPD
ncbi:MAG: Uma2 family endonuclease [Chloroflexi bacterium]|nr:Uma2 family endonuclease [Chloroflexota bacterium]